MSILPKLAFCRGYIFSFCEMFISSLHCTAYSKIETNIVRNPVALTKQSEALLIN